jgi:hypothetical protein
MFVSVNRIKLIKNYEMKRTEKEFKLILSQLRQIGKDECFESIRLKNELSGLTSSWSSRFDDAELFGKTGIGTGQTLHFLSICLN